MLKRTEGKARCLKSTLVNRCVAGRWVHMERTLYMGGCSGSRKGPTRFFRCTNQVCGQHVTLSSEVAEPYKVCDDVTLLQVPHNGRGSFCHRAQLFLGDRLIRFANGCLGWWEPGNVIQGESCDCNLLLSGFVNHKHKWGILPQNVYINVAKIHVFGQIAENSSYVIVLY